MKLNELRDNDGARYKSKRVGRGIGSGKGKTSARGVKGQNARSGVAVKTFEGGQTPIYMRLPKRGFKNYHRVEFSVVNLGDIQRFIDSGKLTAKDAITEEVLFTTGLARRNSNGVKLLAKGELSAKVNVQVTLASKAAQEAVAKVGGTLSISAAAEA